MSKRQFWYLLAVLVALIFLAKFAHAEGLMGGVGSLMGPVGGNGGGGPPSNAITTEAGVPLTTEAGATLVTE